MGFGEIPRGEKPIEKTESKTSKKAREETAEAGKSSSMPLLGPGMSLSPGATDEADNKYLHYARQNTNVSDNAYTRQSTVLTNDTLLTESIVDGATKKIDL